jgi:DnaJ family protein A protein 2
VQEHKIIEVTISKGVKNGDQIVYKKLGNQFPGCVPGDIVFSIKVEDRPDYQRNGDDFICPVEIDILTALTGGVVYYDHPDGRKLAIKVQPFKDFESSLFIPSEGFTNTKTSKKGNLYLKPKVKVKIPFFA